MNTNAPSESGPRPTRSYARHVPTVARVLLGLPLFVFGFNAFLNFLPPPPSPLPAGAAAFGEALMNTGYMLPLIGSTHLIVGTLLLANRFVPLALALFAPFVVNSIAFHSFLEHSGLGMALVFLGLELYLAWAYRERYRPMLAAKATPA